MAACTATTRRGEPCKAPALHGRDVCSAHAGMIGGPVEGAGRKRTVTPAQRLREMVEAELEIWLAPYRQAVTGAVIMGKVDGIPFTTKIPDVGARIAAAEKVFDRVYGRPRQAVEHSGPDGGAITLQALAELAADADS